MSLHTRAFFTLSVRMTCNKRNVIKETRNDKIRYPLIYSGAIE